MLFKRELPLKWRLTFYVLLVWIAVVVMFTLVFMNLSSRIDQRLQHTMELQMLADANAVAANIEFEVATDETTLLSEKVKDHLQSGEDIHSISVLKKDKTMLFTTGNKKEIAEIISKFGSWDSKSIAKIIGNRMVGIVPIMLEGKPGGSVVVYIKSLDAYLSDKAMLSRCITSS